MPPRLIEQAISAILAAGVRTEGERRLLQRLRAVRDEVCARPDCRTFCSAACGKEGR